MSTTPIAGSAAEPATGRLTMAVLGLERNPERPALVTRALESIPGVARVYFNGDTEMVYVEYREPEVTPGRLLAAVEGVGLSVGDVTVRSAAAGEVPRTDVGPEADDLMPDDHSCCGPEPVASATAPSGRGAEGKDAGRNGASQPAGWPFRVRLGLFAAAAVLVLAPALWLVRPMDSSAMGADISVNMSMTGFTPPNFSIPAGKPVSIQLSNVDSPFHGITNGALHQFAIDALGIDVRLDGKQSTVITLPALEAGSYQFYCNVCCGGKVNPSMQGTITVGGTESKVSLEEVSQR